MPKGCIGPHKGPIGIPMGPKGFQRVRKEAQLSLVNLGFLVCHTYWSKVRQMANSGLGMVPNIVFGISGHLQMSTNVWTLDPLFIAEL